MRIVLCCATHRGLLFLERLHALMPQAALTVYSFREEPHEPAFLETIRAASNARGASFVEARQVDPHGDFDLLLAVSWRYIIPPRVYGRARLGAYVFHDSLLPSYRGFSPTVWAMINGEKQTGVTLFSMSEGFDEGDIADQQAVPIGAEETVAEVMERVTGGYLELLERNFQVLITGRVTLRAQEPELATYCCRRLPADNRIDWNQSSRVIHNLVRAVTRPYPGAFTTLDGRRLTVWAARSLEGAPAWVGRVPGRVAQVRRGEGAVVLTGDGALLLTNVQADDGEIVGADEVLDKPSLTLGATGGGAGP
jgi:methionyl-tRNA formyltransferase